MGIVGTRPVAGELSRASAERTTSPDASEKHGYRPLRSEVRDFCGGGGGGKKTVVTPRISAKLTAVPFRKAVGRGRALNDYVELNGTSRYALHPCNRQMPMKQQSRRGENENEPP